jgi:hypothetical protein
MWDSILPRSLDGLAAPSEETLKECGFNDLNTALANIVEALENATPAPKRAGTKEDITTMFKDAIAEGNQTFKRELKVDMKNLKEDILTEAHTYTDIMT